MRKMITAAFLVTAAIGLAGCNNAPAPPAEPVTEELPVEEMAPAADAAAPAVDAMAAPADAAAPAADAAGPEGAGPSSSTGGRVTPPGQE